MNSVASGEVRRVSLLTTGGTIEKTYDPLRGVLQNDVSVLDVMLSGLELEGVSVEGRYFKLIEIGEPSWPLLAGIHIRIASDKERKKWTRGKVDSVGCAKDGLWSDSLFGNTQVPKEDRDFLNDATGRVELVIPVDNPLLRPILAQLLKADGFAFKDISEELQALLTELAGGNTGFLTETFWQKTREELLEDYLHGNKLQVFLLNKSLTTII